MSKEAFTRSKWTIRDSDTPLLRAGDRLDFTNPRGDSIEIKCTSANPANEKRWNNVSDCEWRPDGGAAGHLTGTVVNIEGDSHPFAMTYLSGKPNWIYTQIVPYPTPSLAMSASSSGSNAGGASGNDDTD
ncbi:MAG: hypothetical protein MJA32_13055 [Proteobacteria bacterium]|nr:hypothetical protein [Pseudomonadota bacterium]